MTTDAFAAAAQKVNESAGSTAPAASYGSEYVEDGDGGSSLFGGEKLPALFNKFIMVGERRSGVILKPPTDRQSRDQAGRLKFWDNEKREVVFVDNGRPLKDTVFVLQTDYRFTPQEISDRQIDPLDVEDDKGVRGIFASGEEKKAIIKAIRAAKLRSETEMVGWTLTLWRTGKVKKGEFEGWTWEATLTKPGA